MAIDSDLQGLHNKATKINFHILENQLDGNSNQAKVESLSTVLKYILDFSEAEL